MSLSYDDVKDFVRRLVRFNAQNSTHEAILNTGIKLALGEVSRYAEWWFCEVELKIALDADTRLYPLPTTDAQGNTIETVSVDKKSFRTRSTFQINWEDSVERLDQFDPDWIDGEQGNVEAVGITAGKIFTYKQPSTAFVASNPYLYGRGFRAIKSPNDSDATLPDFEDTIEDIPGDWHEILIPGVHKWAQRQSRVDERTVLATNQEFYGMLVEMKRKCRPAHGFSQSSIPPSDKHTRSSPGWQRGNTDYGSRA